MIETTQMFLRIEPVMASGSWAAPLASRRKWFGESSCNLTSGLESTIPTVITPLFTWDCPNLREAREPIRIEVLGNTARMLYRATISREVYKT